jgi:putative hemolysin
VDEGFTPQEHHRKPWPKLGGMNPAAQMCQLAGGETGIFKDQDKNEVSICRFEDDSFIKSWSLMKLAK